MPENPLLDSEQSYQCEHQVKLEHTMRHRQKLSSAHHDGGSKDGLVDRVYAAFMIDGAQSSLNYLSLRAMLKGISSLGDM